MNRSDKIFLVFLTLLTIGLYVFSNRIFDLLSSDHLEAVVYRYDKEYARIPLSVDQTITVPGELGDVVIETKDNRVRIQTETSPLHICSIMGWVDKANMTLTCLPNGIYVTVENAKAGQSDDWNVDWSIK